MLLRYGTTTEGEIVRKAKIYTVDEHGITRERIDRDAGWAVRRLTTAGHSAYVVGGAIRDLLLGKDPKDFDVATDALPNQIRKLFRRSRIIGRRFRLVHVYFRQDKILEVSTFRAAGTGESNIYGSLGEDAMRRDFSFNALYYCPIKQQLIDYVDGFQDIKEKRLRMLAAPRESFHEDPVRIIRAVKYAAPNNFNVPMKVRWAMRRYRNLLLDCSRERLTEELYKILGSGDSVSVVEAARELGILEVLAPAVEAWLASRSWEESGLLRRLREMDQKVERGEPLPRGLMVAVLFRDVVAGEVHDNTIAGIQICLKKIAEPLMLSNRDSREAAHHLQQQPPRPKRRRRRRRSSSRRPRPRDQRNVSIRLSNESTFSP